jgi:hypothetical protein
MEKSFHILIATIGKDSIFNCLVKLKKQLYEKDYLTIVFDGPESENIDEVKIFTKRFKCTVNIIIESENLGHWGHAIRNKHKNLDGDFVWHIDDDDDIPWNSIDLIRKNCIDNSTMYVFKMSHPIHGILWKTRTITWCEISTQMGIIPIDVNKNSSFEYYYGGDYNYYKKIEGAGVNIEYIDEIIYIME